MFRNKTLQGVKEGLYETIHGYLKEHRWVGLERDNDRMGLEKRRSLVLTFDLLRLILSTIICIKVRGTYKDFMEFVGRITLCLFELYGLSISDLEEMIEEGVMQSRDKDI